MNHLNEPDAAKLLKDGVDGMLKGLDPYTIFLPYNESQEFEIISNGNYVGFGMSVAVIDGQLTVTDVTKSGPAEKSGMLIGDRIIKIDTSFVAHFSNDQLKSLTRGEVNSKAVVVVERNTKETEVLHITRSVIDIKDINFATLLKDSIAYINLDRFSADSYKEILEKLREYKSANKLNGLVLDLRDNPGGLLRAAIKICELFLPQNSLVVSTRGRNGYNQSYYTENPPEYPNLPLIILINENSASASEIVAGAMQDLDRGLVLGKRSFGKGLVQTVFNLPYGNELNVTTAKYYTPSGRCLQRLNYDKSNKQINENKSVGFFFTKNGRRVVESRGITPDTTFNEIKQFDDEIFQFSKEYLVFKFISRINNTNTKTNFNIDSLADEFIKEAIESNSKTIIPELKKLSELEAMMKANDKSAYETNYIEKLQEIERFLLHAKEKKLKEMKDVIKYELQLELLRRNYSSDDYYSFVISKDKLIELAQKYFLKTNYNTLITKKSVSNSNDN